MHLRIAHCSQAPKPSPLAPCIAHSSLDTGQERRRTAMRCTARDLLAHDHIGHNYMHGALFRVPKRLFGSLLHAATWDQQHSLRSETVGAVCHLGKNRGYLPRPKETRLRPDLLAHSYNLILINKQIIFWVPTRNVDQDPYYPLSATTTETHRTPQATQGRLETAAVTQSHQW